MARIRIRPMAAILGVGVALMALWGSLTGREEWGALRVGELLSVALAALLHEIGHGVAAWGWSVPIRTLRLDLFGARMELGGLTGYAAELAVAAGGPLVSLLVAALVWPVGIFWEGAEFFSLVSLGLGLLNLLPVRGLDGGRMLACALSLTAGERVSETVLRLTTGLFLGGLWLLSVYALLRVGETLTLFTFTLCLLFRLLEPQK
ncbi:MAG: site-2 protease family protein [Clostridia bacterium]|nr:site-2 protease family protein [Clostridia bacterium]